MWKHITSLQAYLSVIACGQHSSFQRNVAGVTSRWQHCSRFDRPKISISDLSLQRGMHYRLTNWPKNIIIYLIKMFNMFKGFQIFLTFYLYIKAYFYMNIMKFSPKQLT